MKYLITPRLKEAAWRNPKLDVEGSSTVDINRKCSLSEEGFTLITASEHSDTRFTHDQHTNANIVQRVMRVSKIDRERISAEIRILAVQEY